MLVSMSFSAVRAPHACAQAGLWFMPAVTCCVDKIPATTFAHLQESNEAFDVLESALQNHPYFRTQAAAAAAAGAWAVSSPLLGQQQQQQQLCSPTSELDVTPAAAAAYTAVGDGSGSSTPSNSATQDSSLASSAAGAAAAAADPAAGSGGSSGSGGPMLVSMSAMLSAVRKDRSSFMDKVAEAVQRATPETPSHASAGELRVFMHACCAFTAIAFSRLVLHVLFCEAWLVCLAVRAHACYFAHEVAVAVQRATPDTPSHGFAGGLRLGVRTDVPGHACPYTYQHGC